MNLVEMTGMRKSFFGVEVLHGVDFKLKPGTVHALMGENGAGKSTLMKILAGAHASDGGEVKIDGQAVDIASPSKALAAGIAMIHQELSGVAEMTVAENVFLGREPTVMGFLDKKKLHTMTEETLRGLGIEINPKVKMKHLRVADQQMVEIAKALSQNARIVIMDEPTATITATEVENLFGIIEALKTRGTGIIYISHRMDEIFRISDEITVLRDGENVSTWNADEVNPDQLIKSMVGRELTEQFPKVEAELGEVALEVENLSRKKQYENISFFLRKGEILGIVGLVGAGRTELMHSLFGLTRPDRGKIRLFGEEVTIKSPRDAISKGIAYVTEDRKGEGLVLPMGVDQNITLPSLKLFTKAGIVQYIKEGVAVNEHIGALQIKVQNKRQKVKALSGGNQQKVVLAKWMLTEPKIIILDEPTRGIDVGAKAEIYRIMCEYVARGCSIIMVSSEMPEAMGMADRIIVLSNQKISGEIQRKDFLQETIVQMQFEHMHSRKEAGQ